MKLNLFLKLLQKRAKAFDMSGGMLGQFPWLRYIMPEKTGYNMINQLNYELRDFFREKIRKHHEDWEPNRNDDLMYTYITQMKNEGQDSTFTGNLQYYW